MQNLRKIITCLALLSIIVLPLEAMAAKSVTVSARVGSVNIPTTIQNIIPAGEDTLMVTVNSSAQVLFDFADPDDTSVTYTITPELIQVGDDLYDYRNANTGSVSSESGTVTDVTSTGSTDVQVNYLSPSTTGFIYLTITANDGESVSSKKLAVYVY